MSYHIYILGYKQPGALQACESAVRASLVPGTFCVEVVDNTAENVNIHKRWNDSWKVSGAEWMVYLTADTLPQGGWLHEIHAAREVCGPQYAAFGPSTNSCYNEQAGREPAIVAQAPAGSVVPGILLPGFCMAVRRDALVALGGFREDFTFYGGDVDFMYRLRMAGYETGWVVRSFVYHEWGGSAKKQGKEWYEKAREEGNSRLQAAVQAYEADPGLWYWTGTGCVRKADGGQG